MKGDQQLEKFAVKAEDGSQRCRRQGNSLAVPDVALTLPEALRFSRVKLSVFIGYIALPQ